VVRIALYLNDFPILDTSQNAAGAVAKRAYRLNRSFLWLYNHLPLKPPFVTGLILVWAGQKDKGFRGIIKAVKKELMDILVCPVCKGELKLTIEEENETEVVTGSLHCPKCQVDYPIVGSIPNLLPPEMRD
jgi:uncharacterized protein YbaR (Trm112 family)